MNSSEPRSSAFGQPISVLMPVRDFAAGVRAWLEAWHKAVSAATHNQFEFIVINMGSSDETSATIEEVVTSFDSARLLLTEPSLGAGLQAGLGAVKHDLVLILVPDWPFRPADLEPMLSAMKGVDIVAPVRPGISRPAWMQRFSRAWRLVARYMFGMEFSDPAAWYGWPVARRRSRLRCRYGLRLQDAECGMRLMRRWVLARCPIQSKGAFALVEMYAKANFAGALFAETTLGRAGNLTAMRPIEKRAEDDRGVFREPEFKTI